MLRRILMGTALGALLITPAFAQTVDELVAKNIQAKGGMEKIRGVKTMKVTGKMVMAQGMEAPFVMMAKRPKNTRIEFTFQGMTGVQAYDGKSAWMVMPFLGKKDPEQMPADETKMLDEQSDMDGPLMDWKEKGHKVEYLGKEKVDGSDAYKLKVTLKSGDVRTIYLDADSYLEVKAEGKRTIRGNEVEGESTFGDYKEVGGLMVAHSMENGVKGSQARQKMVFEKVEFNTELADTLFALPAGAKPASVPPQTAGAAAGDSAKSASAQKPAKKATTAKKTTATKKP